MKGILLVSVFLIINLSVIAQNREVNYAGMAIESSKHWIDLDYVGDRIIGHRLDIHLPKTGSAPYPVIIAIYGSAWFSNSSKAAAFSNDLGQNCWKVGLR